MCVDGRFRYLYIVLGGLLSILSVADIANPDLFSCSCLTWVSLDNARFYEGQCQPIRRILMAGLHPKR